LRYAREGNPTLTKKEFTGLVLKIVKDTLALLTRKLQRQGADLEAPDREAGTSPVMAEAMIEQRIAEYLDTLQGKRKAVAHAVLRLHLTSGKIAARFHVSRRKATGYHSEVKSDFTKFLAGDRRSEASVLLPAGPMEGGEEADLGSSDSFPTVASVEIDVQGIPPSALGFVAGTEILPGVRLLKLLGGDRTGEIWKVTVQHYLLALKIVPYTGQEVLCEMEILSGDDRYHPYLA
jgi:hypothetical protein